MNSDQRLVAWMVVILIGLVAWTTYKPWLKAVLFTPPSAPSGGGGGIAGSLIDPFGIGRSIIDPFGIGNAIGLPVSENPATGQASAGVPLQNVQVA